ncbi:hypothetical protein BDW22DRAFT_1361926 [Trametopsis cervina]|nr:hypothetical protein BDW22DRAFT_1361926 [Trametopsis cervina]
MPLCQQKAETELHRWMRTIDPALADTLPQTLLLPRALLLPKTLLIPQMLLLPKTLLPETLLFTQTPLLTDGPQTTWRDDFLVQTLPGLPIQLFNVRWHVRVTKTVAFNKVHLYVNIRHSCTQSYSPSLPVSIDRLRSPLSIISVFVFAQAPIPDAADSLHVPKTCRSVEANDPMKAPSSRNSVRGG